MWLIKEAGGEEIFVTADVSQELDVQTMADAVVEAYGKLDCAFNNAGNRLPINKDGPIPRSSTSTT